MIVLIDTNYIFGRVAATEVWSKKANKPFNDENIFKNFSSSITKLSKKLNVPVKDMILCRDSKCDWRNKLYPKYKAQRKTITKYGTHIKTLYIKVFDLFERVIKINGAEADDIIALLTFHFKNEEIYVISNDKDFWQLPELLDFHSNIHILNISTFNEYYTHDFSLREKVIKGDRSDNIKKLGKNYDILEYNLNKQLIDLSYVPRSIQDNLYRTNFFTCNPSTKPLRIQLGYACINTILREQNIFTSRTVRLETINSKGKDFIEDLANKNLNDLIQLIEWNYKNGIRIMRMSSELFPHKANPKAIDYDFNIPLLEKIGKLARLYKQRLTFHPGIFNVINSPSEEVFQNTSRELIMHADIMDLMNLDQDSVIVVHGGGIYGDKEKAIKTFITNFKRLPENVKRRVVIENCERCYNIEDMLLISEKIKAPVVFDVHHHSCYQLNKSCEMETQKYIPLVLDTWTRRNIKPKFHISEQRPECRVGTHSDYVETIPEYLLEIPERYGVDIDIMIEAKMKEQSVLKLYEKYPQLNPY